MVSATAVAVRVVGDAHMPKSIRFYTSLELETPDAPHDVLPAGAYDAVIADPGRLASLGRAVGAISLIDIAHGVARRARARVTDEDNLFFSFPEK